jgi:hypothetical protein
MQDFFDPVPGSSGDA